MTYRMMMRAASVAFALTVATAGVAAAQTATHGGHGSADTHGADTHGSEAAIGQPGKPYKVSRTIRISMHENYYEPESISVSAGETIRFLIKNEGDFVHEFAIATAEMHKAHAPEMMMMVEHGVLLPDRIDLDAAEKMKASMGHGMHGEGNSVLVEPGKTGEVIWQFSEAQNLQFACNVPGHYESGMMGDIKISH
ncbi:MAG: cupredoxin domain-containing protein [Alphaproteobacteria bacterium]|nr:cupredoxin domain-containing protein [Alphaproteobacteria bacterium]